ncbi:HNH endonuclease [Rahnella contaminans]|uniref:HNH endonuclease n=1 Tax=Rahnella contaminans TaxID=2703882 RepID=UPI0023DA1B2E|nr:HNH endonuclease [Rahnella contaminans]MDF1895095.1 HNH endonuclease [Rahnella contaminans]
MPIRKPLEERFWEKVIKKSEEECWYWTAAAVRGGSGQRKLTYGVIGAQRNASGNVKILLAHRISWEMHNGPIPAGKYIDHICHNTLCVNPNHLRLATPKQNTENQCVVDSRSTSGYRGVSWSKQRNKWRAYFNHYGKQYHAGFHETAELAAEAARHARNKVFTHNDADRN